MLQSKGLQQVQHDLVTEQQQQQTISTGNYNSTGNYSQYPRINHNGKEHFKKDCIYV